MGGGGDGGEARQTHDEYVTVTTSGLRAVQQTQPRMRGFGCARNARRRTCWPFRVVVEDAEAGIRVRRALVVSYQSMQPCDPAEDGGSAVDSVGLREAVSRG